MGQKTLHKGFYKSHDLDLHAAPGTGYFELLNVAHNKRLPSIITYRPLWKSYVYELGRQWDYKPIADWFAPTDSGKERYELVTDRDEIRMLEQIKQDLYPTEPEAFTVTIDLPAT